jgi:glycosyltransferase involved in cell wall biosynthesis
VNIAFLTSGHSPYDDRIYYHFGMTLSENGHKVLIISSKTEINEVTENISVNSFNGEKLIKKDKIIAFRERLEKFSPDIAICQEPLPVIAAKQFKRKNRRELTVIYDITEWYPSPRFLKEYGPVLRWFGFLKLLLVNLYVSYIADAFIFGEWHKSIPYRLLFPFTPYKFITYYPDLRYISYKPSLFSDKMLRLSYSGEINIEKGFGNFMKVVNGLSDINSNLEIEIKMVAWYESENNREDCEPLIRNHNKNVSFSIPGRQNFKDFSGQISDTDIFIDLRKINFENNYSLPIKLFYYAALGRPVIISDLNAVRRDVEIKEFGFPVNPDNTEDIIKIISNYIKNPPLYDDHCINARRLAEEKYNWAKIAPGLLRFIESF